MTLDDEAQNETFGHIWVLIQHLARLLRITSLLDPETQKGDVTLAKVT